ncbi:hypothetical protein RFI_16246 [Reticulomyxa filosa]|uniref:Uncharacterized protein n=1 Tax=Reticulomyxa filosa TaxID=46433 RepID=X6N4X4_RETFI|nr:hypothetical protein RFI_16246 [Reticulomyxa filosa]|eukprot:ETO20958.1 hypothetical protein RFI_16246 [Reticulomyxa filosa]
MRRAKSRSTHRNCVRYNRSGSIPRSRTTEQCNPCCPFHSASTKTGACESQNFEATTEQGKNEQEIEEIKATVVTTQHIKLRTIYVPTDNSSILQMEADALRTQLQQTILHYEERQNELIMENKGLHQALEKYKSEYNEWFEQFQKNLNELKELHSFMLKEYVDYRRNAKLQIEQLTIEKNKIQDDKCNSTFQLKKKIKTIKSQAKKQENMLSNETAVIVHELRKQVLETHEQLNDVQEKLKDSEMNFNHRLRDVKNKLQRVQKKHKTLIRRRRLENEGYRNDITTLQKQLKQLEKSVLEQMLTQNDNGLQTKIKEIETRLMHVLGELAVDKKK